METKDEGKLPVLRRQGDVLIQECGEVPAGAKRLPKLVLAEGEASGHLHQVADPEAAELYERDGVLYLKVVKPEAVVTHNEHGPVTLPKGNYKVWKQREYRPEPGGQDWFSVRD